MQDAYKNHTRKLQRLGDILSEVEHQPTVIKDDEFPDELGKLENDIDDFYDDVKKATGEHSIFEVSYLFDCDLVTLKKNLSNLHNN